MQGTAAAAGLVVCSSLDKLPNKGVAVSFSSSQNQRKSSQQHPCLSVGLKKPPAAAAVGLNPLLYAHIQPTCNPLTCMLHIHSTSNQPVPHRYDPQFLGMLENPNDGMGCWSVGPDTTWVGLVTNATFSNFAKLAQGGYGSRALQPGSTIVVVNADWTGPEDIGQFWERWV